MKENMNENHLKAKEDKNTKENEEMRLYKKILESLNPSKKELKSIKNGLGMGFLAMGLYFLLVFFGIITTFSPRFDILKEPDNLLLLGVFLAVIGVILNENIRNIFQK